MTNPTLNTLLTRREKGMILALAFATAFALGMTAETWNPYTHTPGQVVNDAATPDTLPPCANEDGSGGSLPCHWDASKQGNGIGRSFAIWGDESITYDDEQGR